MAKKGIKGRLKGFLESGPGGVTAKPVKTKAELAEEEDDEDDAG